MENQQTKQQSQERRKETSCHESSFFLCLSLFLSFSLSLGLWARRFTRPGKGFKSLAQGNIWRATALIYVVYSSKDGG